MATRPVDQNRLRFSVVNLTKQFSTWRKLFPPLRVERGILDRWESLATGLAVHGKSAHDTRLVAAMERHGLTHLLTFNLDDFKRYPTFSCSTQSTLPHTLEQPRLCCGRRASRVGNEIINRPHNDAELAAFRRCVNCGCPLGDELWTSEIEKRLRLESTRRARGRPRKDATIKSS